MTHANLLGIFVCLVGLGGMVAACGEPASPAAATGGAAPVTGGTGATGGAPAGGLGGTTPGAGTGTGGSLGGTGGAVSGGAGMPPQGGAGGATSGTGGTAGVGVSGSGGATAGTAGAGASGGSGAGTGGSGGQVACTFTVNHTRAMIPTVETVTFTTDLPGITGARIEFGLAGMPPTMTAPVNQAEPMYRTHQLGMKAARAYAFRIVATSPTGSCTSQETMVTTGALAAGLPNITRTVMSPSLQDRGFIITSGGVAGGGGGGGGIPAYIIDADGDIVWWAPAPPSTSRARMSYDGKLMYMMALNVMNTGGEMRRIGMDGSNPENNLAGLNTGHHDFTVLPDNGIAVIIWSNNCTAIVERSATGTLTTVVANVDTIYAATSDCHTNAINYYAADQTYTLSDRNVNLFVKIRRTGQLVWQFGGQNPIGQTFTGSTSWMVNHGHQYLSDGKFIFFNNGPMQGGQSAAVEYQLNETSWTSTKTTCEYRASGVNSPVLSDVQRLPNGNTLVTYSTPGEIHEVSPTGALVQKLDTTSFGYSEFRKSLYGPPLR